MRSAIRIIAAVTALLLSSTVVNAQKKVAADVPNWVHLATLYGAETFFDQWYEAACAIGNEHFSKVARMLNDHREGLLAYFRHKVSNAATTHQSMCQRILTAF